MRRKSNCRRGEHPFGPNVDVGGGIQRQVCASCGLIELDLRSGSELVETQLFAATQVDSIFTIQSALRTTYEPRQKRFGIRPTENSVHGEAT